MKENQRNEVLKTFTNIFEEAPLVVMTFNEPRIGVFSDTESLNKALNDRNIKQAYVVLNQVKSDKLQSLPQNQFGKMEKGCGISKNDIEAYRFLFVDIDVCGLERNDGVKRNATDEEHERAREVCLQVNALLKSLDFPQPVIIDSANGFHALWKVDLDATPTHERLIKSAIEAIARKVDTGDAKIDCVVGDKARKIKLPGSANNLDEENARFSSIVELPETIVAVTKSQLQSLVATNTSKGKKTWKGSPGDEENEDKSMVELAEEIGDYFMSDTKQVFANVHVGEGKVSTMNITSREFKLFMRRKMKEELQIKIISNEMWKSLVDYLEVVASTNKEIRTIYNRIGQDEDNLYYDLGDESYQSVKITPEGYEIINTPPSIFQRTDLDKPQIYPIESHDFDYWGTLSKFFNLRTEEELQLLGIWLICSFISGISKPLLLFSGAFASGKSTACSILQDIISPVIVRRSSFPRRVDDLVVRLTNACLCSFDNCDKISTEASNMMCQSITEGSYEKRKLYTDREVVALPLKSMIIMNSCESILEKPDILSRTLQFNLQQISADNLRGDISITQEFQTYKPYILDFIFNAIALSMSQPDEDIHYVVRLADWQKVATKVAKVTLDVDSSYVEYLLTMNKNDINTTLIESNPVAVLILKFMERRQTWRGSVTELYNELDHLAFEEDIERNNRLYPRNPSSLSMRLNSLAGTLAQVGITFFIRPVGAYKEIQLKRAKKGGR